MRVHRAYRKNNSDLPFLLQNTQWGYLTSPTFLHVAAMVSFFYEKDGLVSAHTIPRQQFYSLENEEESVDGQGVVDRNCRQIMRCACARRIILELFF